MASRTKENLTAAGHELFTRHGFGQVGLDRVLAQAGLTKTTFYNHFSSKEELIRSTIAREQQGLQERLEAGARRLGGADVREQLLAVYDVLGQQSVEAPHSGALLLNALLEFPDANDPTHVEAARCKQELGGVIRSRTQLLGVAEPRRLAEELGTILDGAVINRQVTRDTAALRVGRTLAAMAIDHAPRA